MTITPNTLSRAAGLAAMAAGLLFIGVNINHPHLDVDSITTTDVVVRSCLKALMAVLALVGITGMYLRQVRQTGIVGLVGYVVLAAGYALITCVTFAAAFVFPSVAGTDPSYVADVIAKTKGHAVSGDIGALETVITVQGFAYLLGGLLFGIALYRARVLARWAAALLAVGGVVTIVLSLLPDALYRLLSYPNGVAMIGLGYSLWVTARVDTATEPGTPDASPRTAVGVE